MRRTLFLTFAIALLAAPFAHAQSSGATPAASTRTFSDADAQAAANTYATKQHLSIVLVQPATFNGCPVGFSAGHSNSLTQLRAQDTRPGVISQALNVRMSNSTRRDIVSAKITVHGLSPHHRITPASADNTTTGDLTRQMQFDLSVDAGKQAATDLRVYGFTSIQRVDLDSLTYADGGTWTASSEHRCSVVPNGLMLVASAH